MLQVRFNVSARSVAVGIIAACCTLTTAWGQEATPTDAPSVSGPKFGTFRASGTWRAAKCKKKRKFMYYEPEGAGPAPIAIYLPGTLTRFDAPIYRLYLERLAARGYVAVSVQYGQGAILCSFGCNCYQSKTRCLFDSEHEASLVSSVARQTRGDPESGIVVWGHSQGGYMAMMAGDDDERVLRALATGATDAAGFYECVRPGERRLPSDRLRIIQGEHDEVTRPKQADDTPKHPGFRRQLLGLTELHDRCDAKSAYSCFRPNGSGFYIVRGSETEDGRGDHRFWQVDGYSHRADKVESLDTHYVNDSPLPWSLDASIDWLAGACGNGVCDDSETAQTCSLDCKAD